MSLVSAYPLKKIPRSVILVPGNGLAMTVRMAFLFSSRVNLTGSLSRSVRITRGSMSLDAREEKIVRYILDENNQLKQVVIVDLQDGSKLVRPSDETLDALKVGYKLVNTRQPKYDPETQHLSLSYTIKSGKIAKVWEIVDGPETTEG